MNKLNKKKIKHLKHLLKHGASEEFLKRAYKVSDQMLKLIGENENKAMGTHRV